MTAHLAETPITVFVPTAAVTANVVDMRVTVRVHDIIGPEHTSQGTDDHRVIKHLFYLGYERQQVIARIAVLRENFVGVLIDPLVYFGGQ